jgi:hypothetical protein
MQQGRRSASMKASYEALQQFAQSTDVGVLSVTPTLSLASNSELRDTTSNAVIAGAHSTKKQKKYISLNEMMNDHFYIAMLCFSGEKILLWNSQFLPPLLWKVLWMKLWKLRNG